MCIHIYTYVYDIHRFLTQSLYFSPLAKAVKTSTKQFLTWDW